MPESEAAPVSDIGSSKGKGRATVQAAFAGSPAVVRDFPSSPAWPFEQDADRYVPAEIDATDLSVINREMNRCRARLFHVSQSQRHAQRDFVEADLAYHRQMRRALVQVSGSTAEVRKAIAEMECEPFENDVVVKRQLVEELRKRSQDVRDDLKAVEILSHNARAQMDLH